MRFPASSRARLTLAIAVAIVVSVLVIAPRAAGIACLSAFTLASAVPLGAAGVLMVFHLTGGRWGATARPALEALCATTPVLAPLFLPIALRAPALYPWAEAAAERSGAHVYFQPWFFGARALLVLLLWIIGGPWLAAASAATPPGRRGGPSLRAACAVGIILYALSVTVAFTDWVAFLEPGWRSSIFGVIIICLQALVALAVVGAWRATARRQDSNPTPDGALADLAGLILTMVLLHAYMLFSQFLVLWSGALPERTSWHVARQRGEWMILIVLAALTLFALPLMALLFRAVKESSYAMLAVGGMIGIGALAEVAWLVIPSAPGPHALALALHPALTAAYVVIMAVPLRIPERIA